MVTKAYQSLHGVGLRPTHYAHILETKPPVGWFEVITENYIDSFGKPRHVLEKIRRDYPIALHGVSLSMGAQDDFPKTYLTRWKDLIDQIQPFIVSDHLCWTTSHGHNSHDLLPLLMTEETVDHVARRISFVQEFLQRQILIENVSSYVSFKHSDMSEWEFLTAIAQKAGCKILLDVNNIYVSAFNFKFDPHVYLNAIPQELVGQFHLAGHTDKGEFLFDTHDGPVIDPVWSLYEKAVARFGRIPTLIEWDDHIPDFETLSRESTRAREIMEQVLEPKQKQAIA